jgi:hypothetical protein
MEAVESFSEAAFEEREVINFKTNLGEEVKKERANRK